MPSEQMQLSICSCRESLDLLRVQLLGDFLQRHPLSEQRVDLLPPCVVTAVAEPMRKPDVVRGEVTSVHLQSRVVVGRWLPIGTRRSRVEVATTPEAVALGHLATHVAELAIAGKLPEDSANSQAFELLNWSFFSVHGCRWGSRLRDLLFLVHARALSPRRWRQPGYRRRRRTTSPTGDVHRACRQRGRRLRVADRERPMSFRR